jgi:hypothetical protein
LIGHLRAGDQHAQRAETVGSLLLDQIAAFASPLPVNHAWSVFDEASGAIDDSLKVFPAALSLANRVGLPERLEDTAFTVSYLFSYSGSADVPLVLAKRA